MTSTTMIPPLADQLIEAASPDPGLQACLHILTRGADGYWWTRPDFIEAAVRRDNGCLRFDPSDAINFVHLDRQAGTAAKAVGHAALSMALRYEISLWELVNELDRAEVELILNAIAYQAGWQRSGHTAVITGQLNPREDRQY